MVDADILNKYGSNNEAIRLLFTCDDPKDPSFEHKKGFEKRISARLFSGWTNSLQNSHLYAAADIAWDSSPIVRENIPLILYAQKKIKIDRCADELSQLGCSEQFVRRNDDGSIKEIDLPRLYETSVNLVRSYLTRRIAPQATKYNNLYPFFKYEPRATDLVGKLRGDALSQRIEIMADQYHYRHLQTQIIRDILLYGRSIIFPTTAWDREVQWVKAPTATAFSGATEFAVDSEVVREGVEFIRPHPSRIFWDMAHPLYSVNTNNGVTYCGFWDIRKYLDILNDANYFNRDKIRVSTHGRDFYTGYRLYFDSQFNAQRIKFSTLADLRNADPAVGNDLLAVAPYYQGTDVDESLFCTEYYERVVPNRVGLGKYPFPVWLRLVVASDDTVVYGEFLTTSTPAIYFGYNENDNRAMNISLAHEIMPFQDQISNLLSQLLLTAKANAFTLMTLDTDSIEEPVRRALKDALKGDKYYATPLLCEYSGNKMRNLGVNAIEPLRMVDKKQSDDITTYFKAITQLLGIIERMLVLSPQELGQAARHEITATEVNEIATSTSTVYDYISDSIDEGRASWKKFIYEALVQRCTENVPIAVKDRYPAEVVQAAGFVEVPVVGDPRFAQQQITGAKDKLIHDYAFSSRDGSDRPSNSQSANILVQLLGNVVNIPGVLQAFGKPKLYEIINEIFRLSGSGYDLKLEMQPGEDPNFQDPSQGQPDAQQAIKQLMQAVQQQGQAIQQGEQENQVTAQAIQELTQQVTEALQEIQQKADEASGMAGDAQSTAEGASQVADQAHVKATAAHGIAKAAAKAIPGAIPALQGAGQSPVTLNFHTG